MGDQSPVTKVAGLKKLKKCSREKTVSGAEIGSLGVKYLCNLKLLKVKTISCLFNLKLLESKDKIKSCAKREEYYDTHVNFK